MKKTYTACLILLFGSIFYYGSLKGGGSEQCPRGDRLTAVNNHPTTCTGSSCHGTVLNQDTIRKDTLGGTGTSSHNGTPTGIEDMVFASSLAVYPTMTTDRVFIETSSITKDLAFAVYSLDGREMMKGQLPVYAAVVTVDVHTLAPSQYVVRVTDGAHGASFRVVKN